MKKSLLFLLGVIFTISTQAQVVGMEVEVYEEHDGVVGTTDLTGYTTYRVYAVLQNEDDFLSAMFGLAATPLNISTTTTFWQSDFGGNTADQILPAVITAIPEVEFDSYITIGKENSASAGNAIQAAQDADEPWLDNFAAGNNLVINGVIGGAWFTLYGVDAVNALPNENGQVLIGQFTTDGELTGAVNGQVFIQNDQDNSTNSICFPFAGDPLAIFGCTDPIATNYDDQADVNDCSCDYECLISIDEVTTTPTTCSTSNNGSAQITVSGQYGGVDYSLDGGNFVAVNNFNNLSAGTHTIEVVDTEGCMAMLEFEVPSPDPVELSISLSQPISCNGAGDAVISGTAVGGTGELTLSLSSDLSDPTTELMFADLGPGLYTVYAEDENGCAGQSTPLTITQPLSVTVNFGNTGDASCFNSTDGTVVGVAFGGTGTLQFSIDGENYQASNIFNVGPGTYTLYAQDANGCVDESNTQTVIGSPDEITFDATVVQPLCAGDNNGAVSGEAMGGNGGFSYMINGEDPVDDVDLTDLMNGAVVTIMVEDVDGCTSEFEYTMNDPEAVTISATVVDPSCSGDDDGEIEVTGAGGTEEFEYSIDGGDFQDTPDFTDLEAGTYSIEVMDSNGCSETEDYDVVDPDPIEITDVTITEESAEGAGDGSIDITVEGGTGSYTFDWSATGFSSDEEDPSDLSGDDLEYTVEITDENGCTYSESFTVTTSVFEIAGGVEFSVAPNPTTGTFFLNVQGLSGQNVSYRIMDASGRMIANNALNGTQAEVRQEIDLNGVSGGLYFLSLQVGDAVSTIRVVKQ